MTRQLRAAGALAAATCALLVLGVPLMILLVLDPSAQAACGGTPTGPGPSSVPGIPPNLLPIFEGAAQQFELGSDGWAYLAAFNDAESDFRHRQRPRHRGAVGQQLGRGGRADADRDRRRGDRQLGHDRRRDPGRTARRGAATERVQRGRRRLRRRRAPARSGGRRQNWQAALVAWNNYPPEIAQVTQLVAQYTQTGRGNSGAPAAATSTAPVPAGGQGCVPVSGPTTPGAVATILPNGLAAIPQGAPPAVQEMIAAGNQIIHYPYSYGGGHSPASMRVPPGPDADPGAQENGGPGYDCSSAVSFVLWGAGLAQSLLAGQVPTSWTLENEGLPGAGQWVTIYAGTSAGQGHTFIEVAGIVLDTVHGSPTTPAGTGPRWQPASEIQYELSSGSFVTRHPQGL